jgi:epoxyqueuosine reductase
MNAANTREIKEKAKELGFHLCGVADVRPVRKDFLLPPEVTAELNWAIILGFRLQNQVLAELTDHPTYLYFNHYRQVNNFLDQSALKLAAYIQEKEHKVIPIPASQVVDWENQQGHLSHKKLAVLAGLGWIGRNNLLVNPLHGAQLRLVTLLTDLPLAADQPVPGDCGECTACVAACPARAIKNDVRDFAHKTCFIQLKDFQKKGYVPQGICGICVKACPGRKEK